MKWQLASMEGDLVHEILIFTTRWCLFPFFIIAFLPHWLFIWVLEFAPRNLCQSSKAVNGLTTTIDLSGILTHDLLFYFLSWIRLITDLNHFKKLIKSIKGLFTKLRNEKVNVVPTSVRLNLDIIHQCFKCSSSGSENLYIHSNTVSDLANRLTAMQRLAACLVSIPLVYKTWKSSWVSESILASKSPGITRSIRGATFFRTWVGHGFETV